jgi:hypothetical protein
MSVIVTVGFREDPNLDVLKQSSWELVVTLDDEQSLYATHLIADGDDGWVTVLEPPSPFGEDMLNLPTSWQLLQWRKDEDGNDTDRAAVPMVVTQILDLVPARFHEWVLTTTEETLQPLEAHVHELEQSDSGTSVDNATTIFAGIKTLRGQLAAGRERRSELRRRQERRYGIHVYDFPPLTNRRWELGTTAVGTEALIIRPARAGTGIGMLRAFIPPDELTPWRWADPRQPEAGGEHLAPAEVLTRVPTQFHGWVAAKTHEALQHARHRLHELGVRTLSDAEDFAQLSRLAEHAYSLAGFSRGSGLAPEATFALDDEDLVDAVRNPDGRLVLLLKQSWAHVLAGHPEMEEHVEAVIETIGQPEHREPDPRVGRERYFRRGGPERWIRVVVELDGPIDRVVTAFPQTNPPEHWRRR